jgi:hypothetical protein
MSQLYLPNLAAGSLHPCCGPTVLFFSSHLLCALFAQILGQLIYDNTTKVDSTLPSFKEAAARRVDDADMWELLAELLAPRDPSGTIIRFVNWWEEGREGD